MSDEISGIRRVLVYVKTKCLDVYQEGQINSCEKSRKNLGNVYAETICKTRRIWEYISKRNLRKRLWLMWTSVDWDPYYRYQSFGSNNRNFHYYISYARKECRKCLIRFYVGSLCVVEGAYSLKSMKADENILSKISHQLYRHPNETSSSTPSKSKPATSKVGLPFH